MRDGDAAERRVAELRRRASAGRHYDAAPWEVLIARAATAPRDARPQLLLDAVALVVAQGGEPPSEDRLPGVPEAPDQDAGGDAPAA